MRKNEKSDGHMYCTAPIMQNVILDVMTEVFLDNIANYLKKLSEYFIIVDETLGISGVIVSQVASDSLSDLMQHFLLKDE